MNKAALDPPIEYVAPHSLFIKSAHYIYVHIISCVDQLGYQR